MPADAAVPALPAPRRRNAGRRARANSSLGARACSRRGADLRARPQGQPRDVSSRCPSARVRRAPRWLTASMPLTAIGELSSLSMSSGRVATSESSEHKGCLWPARIPRRSQTASLRLNKAQRQRRGACTCARPVLQSARESAPDGSKRSTSCSRLQWEPRDEYCGWSSCARRASGCRRCLRHPNC